MKEYLNLTIKSFLYVLTSSIIGLSLLIISFALPTDRINANVEASVGIFEREGTYPTYTTLGATNRLDNYTDALMLMSAAYTKDTDIIDRAINVYHPIIEGERPAEVIVDYYNGVKPTKVTSYARYWHGYLIFLKPLLSFFTYDQIRILNTFLVSALGTLLIVLLYLRNMKRYIIPYILSLLLIDPLVISQSLQFSLVYYIFTIASIIFLLKKDWFEAHSNRIILFFVLIGCATSYFDLLTYPFATFGIPAVLYLCDNKKSFRELAKTIFLMLIAWGIGYIGMWAAKWILSALFMNGDAISDVVSEITQRSSTVDADGNVFSVFTMIKNQLKHFEIPVFGIAMLYVAISGIYIMRNHPLEKLHNYIWIIYIAICLLPFAWYLVASNHSYIHEWMTYRELIISAFSGMCMLARYCTKKDTVTKQN